MRNPFKTKTTPATPVFDRTNEEWQLHVTNLLRDLMRANFVGDSALSRELTDTLARLGVDEGEVWTLAEELCPDTVPHSVDGDPSTASGAAAVRQQYGACTVVQTGAEVWVAFQRDGEPEMRPFAQTRRLTSDVRPADDRRYAATMMMTERMNLVRFDASRRAAVLARLDPFTASVRDRAAAMLSCSPWDIELSIEWSEQSDGSWAPTVVRVVRMPAVLDEEKRRSTWQEVITQLLPAPANTNWWLEMDSMHSCLTARRAEDPLGQILPYLWESAPTVTSIPFGLDYQSRLVNLGLLESNILMGGQPGSGKSGGATSYLCGVSRITSVPIAMIGLDPKRVELAPWKARFSRIATTPDDATEVLRAVMQEVDRRYEYLQEVGKKKFGPTDFTTAMPLILLHVDELADLVSVGATKEEKASEQERATLMRRIVALGRASGVCCVFATQKPSSDVIPTSLRDLIQLRVGFATATPEMTDTVLGSGMSRNGGLCHEIPSSRSMKGVGYVVDESSRYPRRMKSFWVPDEDVPAIVDSVAHLRIELPWMPAPAAKGGVRVVDDYDPFASAGFDTPVVDDGFTLDDSESNPFGV
ncbi:FtsK/SpoIIIE domain-containing protein [Luteococcus peritonei]|uniref:FtsK/SpoIIIE domain-containing protein n=1 Tax=Luteococcus peritonei TaxID=88874 RepID=A0ABW4RW02_9ACTN